jgi:hypothetical protein
MANQAAPPFKLYDPGEFEFLVGAGSWQAITRVTMDRPVLRLYVDHVICRYKENRFDPSDSFDLGTATLDRRTGALGNCDMQLNPSDVVTPGQYEVFVANKKESEIPPVPKTEPTRDSTKKEPARDSTKEEPARDSTKEEPARDSTKEESASPQEPQVNSQLVAAFTFGVIFVVTLIVLAIKFP